MTARPATIERARVSAAAFTVELPTPPSVNAMFATDFKTKRRFITKEYAAWKKEAALMLMAQRARCAVGRVEIAITVQESRGDIDNRIKPTIDCLVENGIIDGDTAKTVRKVSAQWGDVVGALVHIHPAGPQANREAVNDGVARRRNKKTSQEKDAA